jgi:hypothetical protein
MKSPSKSPSSTFGNPKSPPNKTNLKKYSAQIQSSPLMRQIVKKEINLGCFGAQADVDQFRPQFSRLFVIFS